MKKRDLVTERFVDALILSRAYADAEGRLDAQRLVADALLVRRLVYPDGFEGERAAADDPQKAIKHRAAQIDELDKN